jgi:ATP-dependent RNA circularization protein (DNA/RNA ligase family)
VLVNKIKEAIKNREKYKKISALFETQAVAQEYVDHLKKFKVIKVVEIADSFRREARMIQRSQLMFANDTIKSPAHFVRCPL